ncbi:hypothetical protein SAMD00019534_054490 [Acytostelium subglobosum LB1]|uniref:hypothetical protein n=1 Tax=Acytostelium subglobosum LB1 TaxID=1410327 RepID=UPI000644BDC1|nr:hypothetical protein SAMD00019534_054490 [Acytostelium subglobosum LB1]GAM22274.1 hypothetical protein SAMD00019534_054490 [Acytostelium subglobosum LB1]|eukprot:XP_012754394.1 hypothetical protein SAMD00019534_054490 [Acytostelium subglobosum LB1]
MSFRITLQHIKEDFRNIERLEENGEYLNDLVQQLQTEKQNTTTATTPNATATTTTTTSNAKLDIFDYILKNVDLSSADIDNEYEYIKDTLIDSSNSIDNKSGSNTDGKSTDHDSHSTSNKSAHHHNQQQQHHHQSDAKVTDNNIKSQDDDQSMDNNRRKEVIFKKLAQLKLHDDTFNQAFKFIETDNWLNSKGLALVSDDNTATIKNELTQCIATINDSIQQLSSMTSPEPSVL